jgi:hypothetical protein
MKCFFNSPSEKDALNFLAGGGSTGGNVGGIVLMEGARSER